MISYLPDIHRLLPQSPDSEKGVLASLVLAPTQVRKLCSDHGITKAHFHIPAHATVYAALTELCDNGTPVDFLTVTKLLQSRAELEAVGGGAFISELHTFLPTAANAAHYIEHVKRDFMAREIIRIGTEYAARAYEVTEDPEKLAGEAHSAFTGLLVKKSKRQTVRELLQEIMLELQNGQPNGEIIRTGLDWMDEKLDIYRGDLLVVTAPTSCGKSALSNQLAISAALTGKRVALYPLEMRQKQILVRSLNTVSGYNVKFAKKVFEGNGGDAYKATVFTALKDAAVALASANIHMRDDLYSLESIIADIRAEHAVNPFTFITIDYLQLIRTAKKTDRRQLELAYITQTLKQVANELDCAVIVPSQVNKEGGTREAQDAENDASAIIKIHPDLDSENENGKAGDVKPGRVEIWKQREGARHVDLDVKFNGPLTRFERK